MAFEIFKTYPPNRESAVIEVSDTHDGEVDVPAEIYAENGKLKIALFGRKDGVPLEYSLDEWESAIRRAVDALEPENRP